MTKALILFTMFIISCGVRKENSSIDIKEKIVKVLKDQEKAWNNGNIDEYMLGYYQSDSLRFVSGSTITYGWQKTLDGYRKRYPDLETMGKLTFSDFKIDVLSERSALVLGKWELNRKKDKPWGLYTLLFKKLNGKWLIVSDHTSQASKD